MRWIVSIFGVGVMLGALGSSGCTSAKPAAGQASAAIAPATPAETVASADALGLRLSEARLEQQRLDRELAQTREDLYRTAVALKEIKTRLEEVTVYAVSNAARMVAVERELRDVRRAANEGGGEQVKTLRAVLENERQAQQRLQAIVAERDREVRDLREAVRANESALTQRPAASPASTAPAVPAAPAAKPAAPAAPGAPAVRSATPPAASATTVSVYRLVAEGNRALKTGNVERAKAMFERARAREPNLAGALVGLAAIAYQVDDLAEGRQLLESVLSADARNAQALGLRGMIQWRDGAVKDAVRDCARAVELDPNDPLLRKFYGITLHARGQNREAIREMRKAVEIDGSDAEAKLNLAILLATDSKPDLDEARALYEQALALGMARDASLDARLGLTP